MVLGGRGSWGRLEEAGGSLRESRGAWGWLGARKYWYFIGFSRFLSTFGGEEEKKKIKVIGTEGVGARAAWGEPGEPRGGWGRPEELGGSLGEPREPGGAWGRLEEAGGEVCV